MAGTDFNDLSLWELFTMDLEGQIEVLQLGLLALEQVGNGVAQIAPLMRAMHSIKSASRVVELHEVSEFAHQFEDRLITLQDQRRALAPAMADHLLACLDWLKQLSTLSEAQMRAMPDALRSQMQALMATWPEESPPPVSMASGEGPGGSTGFSAAALSELPAPPLEAGGSGAVAASLRVSAEGLSRILGLAGEIGVRSGQVRGLVVELLKLKRQQNRLRQRLERLFQEEQESGYLSESRQQRWQDALQTQQLAGRTTEQLYVNLEDFDRRMTRLSARLGREALHTRMRPLGEGLKGLPRLVRDVARTLDKKVSFTLRGAETPVDRDILEKLQAPVHHLLRNAVDHGIESPAVRQQRGKPEEGRVVLRASHHMGMLSLQLEDDGGGIDPVLLRQRAVERELLLPEQMASLSLEETWELLFLPGFSTRTEVSQVSGRGVGLDVVRSMVRESGGLVTLNSNLGQGTTFHLLLPITRALVRVLLVMVAGEPYAFPLARLDRVLCLPRSAVQTAEGKHYILLQGEPVGISWASQVFQVPGQTQREAEELTLVIIGERRRRHALVVDRFIGERSLVMRPLDARLGPVPGIQSVAILDEGMPILLVDIEGTLALLPRLNLRLAPPEAAPDTTADLAAPVSRVRYKRLLLAEDALVLREWVRHTLSEQGYEVQVAATGLEAWRLLQQHHFDILVTDIEMPEMDGWDLLQRVRQSEALRRLPVVLYSSHGEDTYRLRGLELGADSYVQKQGMDTESLLRAVAALAG